MKKEALLKELSSKVAQGSVSKEEILQVLKMNTSKEATSSSHESSSLSVHKILYVLGATIVVIGIIFFVSQIWRDIGSMGRVGLTLGMGLLLTALGSTLLIHKPDQSIGNVFHFMGGVLIPGGALVTLSEFDIGIVSDWPITITFAVITAFYGLLNLQHKNAILTFFTITNGTAAVYLATNALLNTRYYRNEDIFIYLTMVVGAAYIALARAFHGTRNAPLIGLLHFFGSTFILGSAFYQIFDSRLWQIAYFPLVIGGLALAVFNKSKSILAMSTIFLICYVAYITAEYFADSIGWPVSLVLLGFAFIGLGYASISINKKYISQ